MRLVLLAAVAAALPAQALAQAETANVPGPEVRVALSSHDALHTFDGDREAGGAIEVQLIGPQLPTLPFVGRPRPMLVASANLQGETDFAAVGLAWTRPFSEAVTGELQFGYAVHDGYLESTDPQIMRDRLRLGSRDLFRTALGVDWRVSDAWSVGVQWEHLSHGNVIGEGRNQGIDAAGVRISRKFGR